MKNESALKRKTSKHNINFVKTICVYTNPNIKKEKFENVIVYFSLFESWKFQIRKVIISQQP